MNGSRLWLGAALSCSVLLAGCGFTKSPAEGLAFTAPPGWHASPGIMGMMQFWKGPVDGELLMLLRAPKPVDLEKAYHSDNFEAYSTAGLHSSAIKIRKRVTICGNQPADYLMGEATGDRTGSTSQEEYIQMMLTDMNGKAYFALYVYPRSTPPDARAVAALHQLCAV